MKTHAPERTWRVVITRSRRGNAALAEMLRAGGFSPVPVDTLEFAPPEDWTKVDARLTSLQEFHWLLFTSATGARFFLERMKRLSLKLPWQGRPAVAAVGEGTASALRKEGVRVEFVPSTFTAQSLAEQLPRGRGGDVLILRAEEGDPEMVPILERDGFKVTDLAIYRTSPLVGGGEDAGRAVRGADAIVFASPSAVEAFAASLDPPVAASPLARSLPAFCIGPVTASAARERGFERVLTPETHTLESLLQCLSAAAGEAR